MLVCACEENVLIYRFFFFFFFFLSFLFAPLRAQGLKVRKLLRLVQKQTPPPQKKIQQQHNNNA